MSQKKQIKTLITFFVVLLFAFAGTTSFLFKGSHDFFNTYIRDKSHAHLDLIKTISEVETGLYIFQKSFGCALTSGDDKCLVNMKEAKKSVLSNFAALEKLNATNFQSWVEGKKFTVQNLELELRTSLASFRELEHSTNRGGNEFQRLFYLVQNNINSYFENGQAHLDNLMNTASGSGAIDPSLNTADKEQETLDLVYLGLNAVREHYNSVLWDESQWRGASFTRSMENYFYAMMAVTGLLIVFAIGIAVQINRHFRSQHHRDENLVVLGTRDMATGLFNRRSMESLLGQELQRAKRYDYSLSMLMLRIEPYDEIRSELGQMALDRMFFQISEILRAICRSYDGLFKVDKNSFFIVFPEADPKVLNKLVARLRMKLNKKRFLVLSDQTKVSPTILMGGAAYPMNGTEYGELVGFAEQTLSEDFDAKIIHKNMDDVVSLSGLTDSRPINSANDDGLTFVAHEVAELQLVDVNAVTHKLIPQVETIPPSVVVEVQEIGVTATNQLAQDDSFVLVTPEVITPEAKPVVAPDPMPHVTEQASTRIIPTSEEEIPEIVSALLQEELIAKV